MFDEELRRSLPVRSVVLAYHPNTIFQFWGGEAEERNRPDITMIPIPLLNSPKTVAQLTSRHPELTPLLRDYILNGSLDPTELQALAAIRPVFIERSAQAPTPRVGSRRPQHLLYHVLEPDKGQSTVSAKNHPNVTPSISKEYEKAWSHLYARLSEPLDKETTQQLLWKHYADALYFASIDDTSAAQQATQAALALSPQSSILLQLLHTLNQEGPAEHIDTNPSDGNVP